MQSHNFELAHLKKSSWPFGDLVGVLLVMKTLTGDTIIPEYALSPNFHM